MSIRKSEGKLGKLIKENERLKQIMRKYETDTEKCMINKKNKCIIILETKGDTVH